MHTREGLLDVHERAHRSLRKLIANSGSLEDEQLNRELPGFGYPTVRLQLHHLIGAERYWVTVLEGRMDASENDSDYPTTEALEGFRREVSAVTEAYLRRSSDEELNTARSMKTWRDEKVLIPAHVILRTQTHIYQHQGQVVAMWRLLGSSASALDFPIL